MQKMLNAILTHEKANFCLSSQFSKERRIFLENALPAFQKLTNVRLEAIFFPE